MLELLKLLYLKAKASYEFIVRKPMQGMVASLASTFVSRLAEFQSKFEFFTDQMFISTANRDYLLLLADNILSLKPSQKTKGNVVFYGEVNTIIPEGTVVKDATSQYRTLYEGIIETASLDSLPVVVERDQAYVILEKSDYGDDLGLANCEGFVNGIKKDIIVSNSVSNFKLTFDSKELLNGDVIEIRINQSPAVVVKATKAGSHGNKIFNSELKTKLTIDGLNQSLRVSSLLGLTNGSDFEDTEDFRFRYQNFLANPQAPFNKNDIQVKILEEITRLQYIWVKGGEDTSVGEGNIKVLALNEDLNLTTKDINNIKSALIDIKPAQMAKSRIIVEKPIIKLQKVRISGLIPTNPQQLRFEIEKNISELFKQDLFEKGIEARELDCVIFGSEYRGTKVKSFNLDYGSFEAEGNTFVIFDGLEIGA